MDLNWFFSLSIFTIFEIFIGFVDKSNFLVNIGLKEFFYYSLYDESNLYHEEWKGQDSEAAAVCDTGVLWPKNPSTNKYEVVYDKSQIRGLKVEGLLNYVEGYIELASNIVFRERREGDTNFAVVRTTGSICYVLISGTKERFNMDLYLPPECWSVSVILHEVLHTMGFMHEQQRRDRDQYIFLYRQGTGYESQYNISCENEHFRPFPYDVLSTMQYPNYPYLAYKIIPRDRSLEEYLSNPRTFMTSCDWYALNEVYPGAWKLSGCRPNYVPPSLIPTTSFKQWNKDADKICQYMNGPYFDMKQCILPDGREYPDVLDELKEFIVSSPYAKQQESRNGQTSNNDKCSKIQWSRLRRICEENVREKKAETNGANGNTGGGNNLTGNSYESDDSYEVDNQLRGNFEKGKPPFESDGNVKPTRPFINDLVADQQQMDDSASKYDRDEGANLDENQSMTEGRKDEDIPEKKPIFLADDNFGRGGSVTPLGSLLGSQGLLYLYNPYYKSWIFNKMSNIGKFVEGTCIDRLGRIFHNSSMLPSNVYHKPNINYPNIRRFLSGIMKRTRSSNSVKKNTLDRREHLIVLRKLIGARPLKRTPMSNSSNGSGRHRFLQGRPDTESDAIQQRRDALISEDVSDSLNDTIHSNHGSNSLEKKNLYRRNYLTLHRKLIGSVHPKRWSTLQRPKKSNSPRFLQTFSDTDDGEDAPNKNTTALMERKFSRTTRNMTIEEKQFFHYLKNLFFPFPRQGRLIDRYNWRVLY